VTVSIRHCTMVLFEKVLDAIRELKCKTIFLVFLNVEVISESVLSLCQWHTSSRCGNVNVSLSQQQINMLNDATIASILSRVTVNIASTTSTWTPQINVNTDYLDKASVTIRTNCCDVHISKPENVERLEVHDLLHIIDKDVPLLHSVK
jgi:hypothetical protein